MSPRRIVSFLPAATEMIYMLGLEDQLVGRSHECDYPARVTSKPLISDCALELSRMTPAEIDVAVTARLASGKSLYSVDEATLHRAAPDLLVTQNLCQVCGPAGNEVSHVLRAMPHPPQIIWQSPRHFQDVLDAVRILGEATGTLAQAERWIESAAARIRRIVDATQQLPRVRVSFLEWVDPIYCGGHWVPEMLGWAGAEDRHARVGTDSVRIPWEAILEYQPEVILVAPCGFNAARALAQAALLQDKPGWHSVPAVKSSRVHAVDANAYFARPGPRLVDGVELLAHLVHPEQVAWGGAADAFATLRNARDVSSGRP